MPTGASSVGVREATLEDRVLDAARTCCERWGRAKVTVDDIATEAGTSRATVYRLFPGGRDNLFETLRARDTRAFFEMLSAHLAGAATFEELVVRAVVEASRALRGDEHLQVMLASAPGETASGLTVEGLPRIFRIAAEFLTPWFSPYIGPDRSARLSEWLSRVVVSYFLVPSEHVDLADPASATEFIRLFVLPAFSPPSEVQP
jgi:AcrR family transcriptional regulator